MAMCLAASPLAIADPIHPVPGGGYWHHDSGWVFPERIGDFVRVGIPQDVAGSTDAVAHYACDRGGRRIVASVDVFAADSAAEFTTLESMTGGIESPATLALDAEGTLLASRIVRERLPVYFVDTGPWRVRVQFTAPPDASLDVAMLDAFVRGQRWDTLPR
jgi:hypothetical protein